MAKPDNTKAKYTYNIPTGYLMVTVYYKGKHRTGMRTCAKGDVEKTVDEIVNELRGGKKA